MLSVTLFDMNPNYPCKIASAKCHLSPISKVSRRSQIGGVGGKDFLPSLYRSYAVEERKLRDRATTNPNTVKSTLLINERIVRGKDEFTPSGHTNLLIQVIVVTHPETNSNGKIILGMTDPYNLRKKG